MSEDRQRQPLRISPADQGGEAPSDAVLLRAVARGDHAAFATLYTRHRDWVANVAHRYTRDRDSSLDVMQEVFAYLVRRPPTLRDGVRLTTFLYTITRSRAIDARRRAAARGTAIDSLRTSEQGGVSDGHGHEALEERASLRRAVDALDEPHREVLLMRFVSGMSLAEIASALEVPLGTVKSRLHAALRALSERAAKE